MNLEKRGRSAGRISSSCIFPDASFHVSPGGQVGVPDEVEVEPVEVVVVPGVVPVVVDAVVDKLVLELIEPYSVVKFML